MKNKRFKIAIVIIAGILFLGCLSWLMDTKIRLPRENVMFLIYETQFDGEITDSGRKENIIEIIESLRVRRNIFGEYLPVRGFTKTEGNVLITIMDANEPKRYEVCIRAKGKSFLNIPGKGKFIIENKEVLLDYLEKNLQ